MVVDQFKSQWEQVQSAWVKDRMPHALLCVGPYDCARTDFIKRLTQLIFCAQKGSEPCFKCSDCHLSARYEHPDMHWIKADKSGGAIKIDQIRELQNDVYLTPRRAQYRLFVIESADRMNTASANALLKILEEPPQHTLFLLLAEQLSTVLPTVLSRSQILYFTSHDELSPLNSVYAGKHFAQESEQAVIIMQSETILDELIAVIEEKESFCVIAARWNQFELKTLLWFLYLVYAQIMMMHLNGAAVISGPAIGQLKHLASLLSPMMIFSQIDTINTVQRKLTHNQHVNQILVLENLLLRFVEAEV